MTTRLICVIPDAQVKPGVNIDHLRAAGNLIVAKKPEVIVCLGDFADLPSLSSYDKGRKAAENRRIHKDLAAATEAMNALLAPIEAYNAEHPRAKYKPRKILTLGNHEDRMRRAAEDNPELDGLLPDMGMFYETFGWEVYPYMDTVEVSGVVFSHFLTSGAMGRPIGTAAAILSKKHQSAVVGHQQGRQIHDAVRANGKRMCAIIAGSFYSHKEDYLGPQGNRHWRGMLLLHDVRDGEFIEQFYTLGHLIHKYGSK